jgi:hypothetical protein
LFSQLIFDILVQIPIKMTSRPLHEHLYPDLAAIIYVVNAQGNENIGEINFG